MRGIGANSLAEAGSGYTVTLDDDPIVPRIIEETLRLKTLAFPTVSQFLESCERLHPVAAFVDVHLADGECGLDVIPQLKFRWPHCPTIVLTGDSREALVAQALIRGADDFILKPIRPTELIARLLTRKSEIELRSNQKIFRYGDLILNIQTRTLQGPKGRRFQSPREADILAYLIQQNGTVIDKAKLRHHIWGDVVVGTNALDRKLFEVRSALKDVSDRVRIESSYGQGIALRLIS